MKFGSTIYASIICLLFLSLTAKADITYVTSQQEFDNAHNSSATNDSIVWRSGTYADIFMEITNDDLYVSAETLGRTIFNGASRVDITGDNITLRGFQFLDGNIGTRDVINTRGSSITITQINIRAYTCYKYLRVRESSQYVDITYCNFENRLNLDDQNILSILVDAANPGYHKVQYCSFKNFNGTGNDLGIEPIRIGLSTQADRISRSVVEYCYFTQCNGDGELISSKASQNVYRHNTFENNPKAELVLRHGNEAIVYGNFFLNGKGGVRVREGQNHYIYNNYFYEIDDRAIYLQNESSDPLDNINIAFNTIVDCSEVILGGDGSFKPTNVTFSNNIFADPDDLLLEEATGSETWIGNIAFGNLGISLPANGLTVIDPELVANSEGFFGLSQNSPAINAAKSGYAMLPQFSGVDDIDVDILFDLMGQPRPQSTSQKDLGCSEYPNTIVIQPMATEANTGPSYNTSASSNTRIPTVVVNDLIALNPNPVHDQLNITIHSQNIGHLQIELYNSEGRKIKVLVNKTVFTGDTVVVEEFQNATPGLYTLRASIRDNNEGIERLQTVKFIKIL